MDRFEIFPADTLQPQSYFKTRFHRVLILRCKDTKYISYMQYLVVFFVIFYLNHSLILLLSNNTIQVSYVGCSCAVCVPFTYQNRRITTRLPKDYHRINAKKWHFCAFSIYIQSIYILFLHHLPFLQANLVLKYFDIFRKMNKNCKK